MNPATSSQSGWLTRVQVQTLVFPLPTMKANEVNAALRFKVQATLPVYADDFVIRTRVFRLRGQTWGAAFLLTDETASTLPRPWSDWKVAVPLTLPLAMGPRVLILALTSEGADPLWYENSVLTAAFPRIRPQDRTMLDQLIDRLLPRHVYRWSLGSDQAWFNAWGTSLPPAVAKVFVKQAPRLEEPRSLLPAVPWLLAAAGVLLLGWSLEQNWALRVERNTRWQQWITSHREPVATPAPIRSPGLPVPEIFVHLAKVWPEGTKIVNLEWKAGQLTVVGEGSSALKSLRALEGDPVLGDLKAKEIRTLANGQESFLVSGSLGHDR